MREGNDWERAIPAFTIVHNNGEVFLPMREGNKWERASVSSGKN